MNLRVRRFLTPLAAVACLGVGASVVFASAAQAAVVKAERHASPFGIGSLRAPSRLAAANAAASTTIATIEWVSNSIPVGGNTGCADPGYSTISAALAAAPSGATIEVCSGTYDEQLAITKSATLKAAGAVTVQGPSSPASNLTACDADGGTQPNQDVVDICGTGITVTINGFTIQGGWPANVCYDSIYGVAVLGGARMSLTNSTVEDVGGDPLTDGCQGGVGIEVGLATGPTTADPGSAALSNDIVSNYQKNGVTVDGAGSSSRISGVTVEGAGPTPAIAQNGIQISDGAAGAITGSVVSGDECNDTPVCGPNGFNQTQATGILLFDAGKTSVSSTTVTSSDIGVYSLQDYPWAYYTPPSPFTPVVEVFSGLGLANRYENAYFDEGKAFLTNSHLSGGEVGVEVAQWNGQATSAAAEVRSSTITGASQDAVLVASDQVSGDLPVKLAVLANRLDTTNAAGVTNQSYSIVNATKNWWGDPSGPSDWGFGAGSSVSSDVNFFPWATNSGISTFEPCTTGADETTTANDVVLCASGNAYLANDGSGDVLLIGNDANDQLVGSATGETWIIGGKPGNNVINGNNGTGFIQLRGNTNDTVINASNYTIAPN